MTKTTTVFTAAWLAIVPPLPAAAQEALADYEPLVGSWKGELEYLDYGDDRTLVTLPTRLVVRPAAAGKRLDLEFTYQEPDGSEVSGRDQLYRTPDGLYFGDHWTIEEQTADEATGALRLVLARQGRDNDRQATIRNTVLVDRASLTVTKHVSYSDTAQELQRHQFRFRRATQATPALWFDLTPGPYIPLLSVEYLVDDTRPWYADGSGGPALTGRPVRTFIWKPAAEVQGEPLRLGELLGFEPDSPDLQSYDDLLDERAASTFSRQFFGEDRAELTERLRNEFTWSHVEATPAPGVFPLIVHSLGRNDFQLESTVLWEYLASHGYVVAVVPQVGPGPERDRLEFTAEDMALQAQDLAFVARRLRDRSHIRDGSFASIGYSSGSVAAFLLAQRDPGLMSIVALDGSIATEDGRGLLEPFGWASNGIEGSLLSIHRINRESLDEWAIDQATKLERYIVPVTDAIHFDFQNWPLYNALYDVDEARSAAERTPSRARDVFLGSAELTLRFLEGTLNGDDRALELIRTGPLPRGLAANVRIIEAHASAAAEQDADHQVSGAYALEAEGLRSANTGLLEVVGAPGDYFGRLTFDSDPPRVFAVRLAEASADSMYFTLPGDGYLVLRPDGDAWAGDFKYFGTRATLRAHKAGEPAPDLVSLTSLEPLGVGTISTDAEETFPALSPDGKALLFTRDGSILVSELGEDSWTGASTAPFSGEHNDSAPYFAPDGQSLLFTSNRPNPDHELAPDQRPKKDLWIVTRRADGSWGSPVPLPAPVNVDTLGEYHGGLARNGVVYFVSYDRPGGYGRSDIYRAELAADGYEVTNLGPTINTAASEADVYVDPEERFILFAATDLPGGLGQDDIYISYRRGEGWSSPENLGPVVNSFAYEYGPWIDLRDHMLYFTSYRRGSADVYRVPLDALPLDLR